MTISVDPVEREIEEGGRERGCRCLTIQLAVTTNLEQEAECTRNDLTTQLHRSSFAKGRLLHKCGIRRGLYLEPLKQSCNWDAMPFVRRRSRGR